MYMYGNIFSALTTEPRDGCLRNFVGMKCSWPHTCFKVFRPYLPRGGSKAGQKYVTEGGGGPLKKILLQTARLQ